MKVLLIKPPYTRLKGVGQSPYFPLGLGYVASVLRNNGYEVMIYQAENPSRKEDFMLTDADISFDFRSAGYQRYHNSIRDMNHYVWREVKEVLHSYRPDIVGITMLSVEVASALTISTICKEHNDKCHIVWGGVHPTFLFEDCLRNKEVNFVVRGEGEYAMLELCQVLEKGKHALSEVKGLSFKENGNMVHNAVRPPIPNLDDIPFPARDCVIYPETFDFKSLGSMIISRGCPFRCTFCSSRNFWDKHVRFRSPENMLKEIELLKTEHGTNHIMFWDDTLTINTGIIEKYCSALIRSKLKVNWKASTRADLVDEDSVNLMKKAGCAKLEIGVESGSDRMKKLIRKDVTNDQIKKAFKLINRKGIGSGAFFMAGFPEETMNDLEQTFQLMKELDATEMAFNIFDPMPGSDEYDKCLKFGLVPPNPDWNEFRFWPDAHYVRDIDREKFSDYVNMVAEWLYSRNNSFRFKFRRNRYLILSLLSSDPTFLLKKTCKFILRRRKVRSLRRHGPKVEGKA